MPFAFEMEKRILGNFNERPICFCQFFIENLEKYKFSASGVFSQSSYNSRAFNKNKLFSSRALRVVRTSTNHLNNTTRTSGVLIFDHLLQHGFVFWNFLQYYPTIFLLLYPNIFYLFYGCIKSFIVIFLFYKIWIKWTHCLAQIPLLRCIRNMSFAIASQWVSPFSFF